ncbi:NRDE family protein [Flavobacteriaceae bacterium M23B6Z8]
MCTVSYVSLSDGFVLTSNRDEDPNRKTSAPKSLALDSSVTIEAPIDQEKGGTWIAMEPATKRVACLLNGARTNHKRTPPYRKSRGKIVLDAFLHDSFEQYALSIQLEGIEPFTLILADGAVLLEMVWDGTQKELSKLDSKKPWLWSSSTLYSSEEKRRKQHIFDEYLKKHPISSENMWELHGAVGRKDFILERVYVKTVSITQIKVNATNTSMRYQDRKVLEKVGL